MRASGLGAGRKTRDAQSREVGTQQTVTVTSPSWSNLLISAIPGIMALCVHVCVRVYVKKGGRRCRIARYVTDGEMVDGGTG